MMTLPYDVCAMVLDLSCSHTWFTVEGNASVGAVNIEYVVFALTAADATALRSTGRTWRVVEISHGRYFTARPDAGDATVRHKKMWVKDNHVRPAKEHTAVCSAKKLAAWKHTEYDGMLLSDLDVRFAPFDAAAWFTSAHAKGGYFGAALDHGSRQYDGFNTSLVYLRPDQTMARLLVEKAVGGDYVPHMNTEQDVLETAFSPHAESLVELPLHEKMVAVPRDACDGLDRVGQSGQGQQRTAQGPPPPDLPRESVHVAEGNESAAGRVAATVAAVTTTTTTTTTTTMNRRFTAASVGRWLLWPKRT